MATAEAGGHSCAAHCVREEVRREEGRREEGRREGARRKGARKPRGGRALALELQARAASEQRSHLARAQLLVRWGGLWTPRKTCGGGEPHTWVDCPNPPYTGIPANNSFHNVRRGDRSQQRRGGGSPCRTLGGGTVTFTHPELEGDHLNPTRSLVQSP